MSPSLAHPLATSSAILAVVGCAVAGSLSAQGTAEGWSFRAGYSSGARDTGDETEWLMANGVLLHGPGMEIRADNALVLTNRDSLWRGRLTAGGRSSAQGPSPRRGIQPPPARRELTEAALRQRLQRFVRRGASRGADQRSRPSEPLPAELPLGDVQSLYLEGSVSVLQDGLEVVRATRLFFSVRDDRIVLDDATLRLRSAAARGGGEVLVTVRGNRILRQGARITGRDLSVTTSTAADPRFEVRTDELELIERGEEYEVRVRGNDLAIHGVSVLPLPNTSFYTGDQNNLPIQGASVGYSSRQGMRAQIDFGSSFNRLGGKIHNALTGRSPDEFRGDWHLGVGWIEQRGFPIEPGLVYRVDGLYSGRTRAFFLDDTGPDLRDIQTHIDGTPINASDRQLVHTENRFWLTDETRLDATLFYAKDPAVLSEFFSREYLEDERPETNLFLRHGYNNQLITASGRFNLAGFSYDDDRSLAPAFVEQLPVVTYDVFAQPLFDVLGHTALLSASTEVGVLQSDFDNRFAGGIDDQTFRFDQRFELAVPFRIGPIDVRPFGSARFTHYDRTRIEESGDGRFAFTGGVSAGTWLAKTWNWTDTAGAQRGVRHVIAPYVRYIDRFRVENEPGDYFQRDPLDALDERATLRFEILNRLVTLQDVNGERAQREFLWLDLAQNFFPVAGRDNRDEHLGLFEYELIVRPSSFFNIPDLSFLFEGEHDWDRGQLRTMNAGVLLQDVANANWRAEYRTDQTQKGVISYGVDTQLFGRWEVRGGSQYDLATDRSLNYNAEILRDDRDWRLSFGINYDNVSDDTRFYVNFEPSLGGLFRRRRPRYLGGSRRYGFGRFTDF